MRKTRFLAVGGGLLLFLAACGGDDSQPGGSAATDASSGGNATTGSGGSGGSNPARSGGSSATGGGAGTAGAAPNEGGPGPTDATVTDTLLNDSGTGAFTIVAQLGKPTGIALSATDVYWADEEKGTISTCPKTGCGAHAPTVVVTTTTPRGIALRGTTLYWVSAGQSDAAIVSSTKKCTLGACAPNQIVDMGLGSAGGPFGSVALAADDQRIYVVGGPVIDTCPVAGCGDGGLRQLGAIFMGPLFGVAVDATNSYTGRYFGGVTTCPLSGCSGPEDETRIVNSPSTMAIAVDSTNVYWAEYPFLVSNPLVDGAIRTCAKSGCDIGAAKVLATGSILPYALAVDDTSLYFTDNRNGRVERIPKNDFAHTCVVNHLATCEACAGSVKCDGACSASCNDAASD